MNYLVLSTPSEPYAAAISSALWGLARPPAVRKPEDTQNYTSWIVKPDESAVALFVPDDTRPVHPAADLQPLLDLMAPAITDAELTAITEAVESARGGRIRFKSLVEASPSLSANLRTKAQLEADGWFPANLI